MQRHVPILERILCGTARIEDIDNEIDKWHFEEGPEEDLPLHEYLGMTHEEYSSWLTCPSSIAKILSRKRVYCG